MRRSASVLSYLVCGSITMFAASCGSSSTEPPSGSTPDIAMQDDVFVPRVDTVDVGTTVTWTNEGSRTHTTTSDTGLWDSGQIAPSNSFSMTFDEAGAFPYHCTFHGSAGEGMAGTIVVK